MSGLGFSLLSASHFDAHAFGVPVRTLHLQGVGRADFSLWYSDIQRAAGGKGNALRDQQMSRNDIPIIVDSCIAFITQYGEED